jgi:hypothetical protein
MAGRRDVEPITVGGAALRNRAGSASLPAMSSVGGRYAEARPNAPTIIAARWSGGAMKTSSTRSRRSCYRQVCFGQTLMVCRLRRAVKRGIWNLASQDFDLASVLHVRKHSPAGGEADFSRGEERWNISPVSIFKP